MPAGYSSVVGLVNAKGERTTEGAFEAEKTATGTYKIVYVKEGFPTFSCPVATPIGTGTIPRLENVSKDGFTVKFTLLATLLLTDTEFSFVSQGD